MQPSHSFLFPPTSLFLRSSAAYRAAGEGTTEPPRIANLPSAKNFDIREFGRHYNRDSMDSTTSRVSVSVERGAPRISS